MTLYLKESSARETGIFKNRNSIEPLCFSHSDPHEPLQGDWIISVFDQTAIILII